MTDIPEDEWRYSINYGPEGEANYAFVYDGGGHLVSNLKIHHAIAIVEQMNRRAAQAERMARLEDALRPFGRMVRCHVCDRVEYADGARSVMHDYPMCHGFTMKSDFLAGPARALSQEGSEPS